MIYTLVRKDVSDSVDAVISFDSVSSSDESWSATVTTQVVEKGFNITDNINIEPPTYSINAVISGYSLFNLDNEIVWDGDSFQNIGEDNTDSHLVARDEIIRIFKERSVLSLVESTSNSTNENLGERYKELQAGHHKETDNCVITSLSISHPDSGTGAFHVSIKLQKIHIALVTVTELQEGETTPLVRPLLVNVEEKGSKTKKTTDEERSPISIDIPETPEDIASLKAPAGRTQADFLRYSAKKIGDFEDKNESLRVMNALIAKDKIRRKQVFEGGSWGWKYLR